MEKGKSGGALACCAMCGACAVCCIFILIVIALSGLGIAKIVMGAVYLKDCELEPLIPIWLIVGGVVPIVMSCTKRPNTGDGEDNSQQEESKCSISTIISVIGGLFSLAWLICGSVWIYPNYSKRFADDFVVCTANVTTDCSKNCDENLMKFSFAMVTIDWIICGLFIIGGLCTAVQICKKVKGSRAEMHNLNQP